MRDNLGSRCGESYTGPDLVHHVRDDGQINDSLLAVDNSKGSGPDFCGIYDTDVRGTSDSAVGFPWLLVDVHASEPFH